MGFHERVLNGARFDLELAYVKCALGVFGLWAEGILARAEA